MSCEWLLTGGSGAGGNDDAGPLASTEIYWPPGFWYGLPSLGAFLPGPTLTAPRSLHTATRIASGPAENCVLLAGGTTDGASASAFAELFIPGSLTGGPDVIELAGPMSQARVLHAAAALPDGRVLAAGGSLVLPGGPGWPVEPLASAEIFDPTAGVWTDLAPMPAGIFAPAAAPLADGTVAVVASGGAVFLLESLQPVRTTVLFDPDTLTFRMGGSMRLRRVGHSLVALADGTLLAAGGLSEGQAPAEGAETFDPTGTFDTGSRFAGGLSAVTIPTNNLGLSQASTVPFDVGPVPGTTRIRTTLAGTSVVFDYYVEGVVLDQTYPIVLRTDPHEGGHEGGQIFSFV